MRVDNLLRLVLSAEKKMEQRRKLGNLGKSRSLDTDTDTCTLDTRYTRIQIHVPWIQGIIGYRYRYMYPEYKVYMQKQVPWIQGIIG